MKANDLLNDEGRLSLIYPYEFMDELFDRAEEFDFKTSRITRVRPTPSSDYKRILFECLKSEMPIRFLDNELIIENSRHNYSLDFIQIVKDFYLKL